MHILKNLPNEMEEVRFFEFSERFARRGILAGLNSGENVTVRTRCNPFLETRTRAQWKEDACNLPFPFVRQMDIFFSQRMEIGSEGEDPLSRFRFRFDRVKSA